MPGSLSLRLCLGQLISFLSNCLALHLFPAVTPCMHSAGGSGGGGGGGVDKHGLSEFIILL